MVEFKYLIKITPLGLMYGSAGAFLSPTNLVGRSGHKFPPDAAAVTGLLLNANRNLGFPTPHHVLRKDLYIAGPFWAEYDDPHSFHVPLPRHYIISRKGYDEWRIEKYEWTRSQDKEKRSLESDYYWQSIKQWDKPISAVAKNNKSVRTEQPWKYVSFLHPRTKDDERVTLEKDGLFLENAVRLDDNFCLIYLSTHCMPEDGWYRFGGEGHMVEVESQNLAINENHKIYRLLHQQIQDAFALIVPGVWGSNNLSHRYPKNSDFPKHGIKMLTDKPIPYRFRLGSSKHDKNINRRLGRGRYAVPVGTVYVVKQPLNLTWCQFPDDWFPREGKGIPGEESDEKGLRLKHFGCGLCLPITVNRNNQCTQEHTVSSKP